MYIYIYIQAYLFTYRYTHIYIHRRVHMYVHTSTYFIPSRPFPLDPQTKTPGTKNVVHGRFPSKAPILAQLSCGVKGVSINLHIRELHAMHARKLGQLSENQSSPLPCVVIAALHNCIVAPAWTPTHK